MMELGNSHHLFHAKIGSIDLHLNKSGIAILRSKDQRSALRQFLLTRSKLVAMLYSINRVPRRHEFLGCGNFSTVYKVGQSNLAVKQVGRFRGNENIASMYTRNRALFELSKEPNTPFDAPEIFGYLTFTNKSKIVYFLLLEVLQAYHSEEWEQIINDDYLKVVNQSIFQAAQYLAQIDCSQLSSPDYLPRNFLFGRRIGEPIELNRPFVIDQ